MQVTMQTGYVVIYRPHNALMCETETHGPFTDWGAAYDYLCSMPALGVYRPDGELNNPGVKFVDSMRMIAKPA